MGRWLGYCRRGGCSSWRFPCGFVTLAKNPECFSLTATTFLPITMGGVVASDEPRVGRPWTTRDSTSHVFGGVNFTEPVSSMGEILLAMRFGATRISYCDTIRDDGVQVRWGTQLRRLSRSFFLEKRILTLTAVGVGSDLHAVITSMRPRFAVVQRKS